MTKLGGSQPTLGDHVKEIVDLADERGLDVIRLDLEIPASAAFFIRGKNGRRGRLLLESDWDLIGCLKDLIPPKENR